MANNWRTFAACADSDIDFFTTQQSEKYKARALCRSECPVRLHCLQHALNQPELNGIWGGVDEYEIRRALSVDKNGEAARRARPPRCPSCGNRDLEIVHKKRNSARVTCAPCGLSWSVARAPRATNAKEARTEG